jgi:uncharacterized protein
VIVVADTGPLYALIDRDDVWHHRVRAWWSSNAQSIVVPDCVIPEVSYLLQRRMGPAAELAFIDAVARGEFMIESVRLPDIARAAELMRQYLDLPLGYVDAAVLAVAERLRAQEILTTDRRHFGTVRLSHARSLRLVP